MSEKMTWDQVVALEPRLQILFDQAASAGFGREAFCASEAWFGVPGVSNGLKQRVMGLVGWQRKPMPGQVNETLLQSHMAYDAAYQSIYEQLPDCRNSDCGCMG